MNTEAYTELTRLERALFEAASQIHEMNKCLESLYDIIGEPKTTKEMREVLALRDAIDSSRARTWLVDSFTEKDVTYTVTRDEHGLYTCSCPDNKYRGSRCKHITWAKDFLV